MNLEIENAISSTIENGKQLELFKAIFSRMESIEKQMDDAFKFLKDIKSQLPEKCDPRLR